MRRASLALVLAVASACERAPPAAAAPPAPLPDAPQATSPAPPPREGSKDPDWGEPDLAKIAKLFKGRFPEVKRCYEAALVRDEDARGKFTLRFTILPTGAVSGVSAAASTFRDRAVPACVADVVRRWRTPFRPAEPVDVEYPLRFAPR